MLEFSTIAIHQIIFQGMFVAKNYILRKNTGKQIRGKNVEATVSIIFFALFIAISLALSFFQITVGEIKLLSKKAAIILAFFFISANLIISVLSLVHLKNSWRVGVVEDQKTELVTDGIYGYTRNPYFLSYILMFAAYAILLQNLILLALSFAGVFMVHKMITKEETFLLSLHGDTYLNYKLKVPRYFII